MKKNWFIEISKPSIVFLVGLTCFVIITMDFWRTWKKGESPFSWDAANYYSYLPAFFANNGSFELEGDGFVKDYLPVCPYDSLHIPKTTYGMALMFSPYYALGYKIAINQKDPLNGLSEPFSTTVHWGMIFYGLFGLLLLRNLLVKFFSEIVTTLTLAVIFLGTNLFYYDLTASEMSHAGLFFLFSAFMLVNYHWHQKQTIGRSILIGFLLGLIVLIRPTDIIIALLFVLWPIGEKFDVKEKALFLLRNYKGLLLMAAAGFLVWLPQLLFWHSRTGHYFYFSYQGERFFWADPQILNVLFSYRKGLFVYTPLIALAFIGFFIKNKELKVVKFVVLPMTVLNIYIVSCWWDWFFGGSFGARAFVQHFAYLSIPMAILFKRIFELDRTQVAGALLRLALIIIISLGISINLFQTYQSNIGLIHYHSMTKKTYWLVFGKTKLSAHENGEYWGGLKEPNYDKLRSGEDRDQ